MSTTFHQRAEFIAAATVDVWQCGTLTTELRLGYSQAARKRSSSLTQGNLGQSPHTWLPMTATCCSTLVGST